MHKGQIWCSSEAGAEIVATALVTSTPAWQASAFVWQPSTFHMAAAGGQRKAWSCQLCTFADNPWHFLRCMICDERRGTTSRDFAHEEEGPAKNSSRQDSTREQNGCQGTRSSLLDHDRYCSSTVCSLCCLSCRGEVFAAIMLRFGDKTLHVGVIN